MAVGRKLVITRLATCAAWLIGPRRSCPQVRCFVMCQPLAEFAQEPARRPSLGELMIEPQDQVERSRQQRPGGETSEQTPRIAA